MKILKCLCFSYFKQTFKTKKKHQKMEQLKKFFALMLPALAAVAAYDLIIKPIINKAKTSLPASVTGGADTTTK